jgi:hypothetical protein
MTIMLRSELISSMVLSPLSKDVWYIEIKTNLGSLEVDFRDDKFKIVLGSIDKEFGEVLVKNGYLLELESFSERHIITLDKTLKSTAPKFRVKYTKKFIELLKRYERCKKD